MLRREVFERVVRHLSAKGFKILLDIFASSPTPLKAVELPFTFGSRIKGESKLDTMVAWEYAMLLLDKMLGAYVPVRFLMYLGVGTFGLLVHFIVLWFGYKSQGLAFAQAQTIATTIAMVFNYWLNQRHHLSRPKAERHPLRLRILQFRDHLQHRCVEQYRRCVGALHGGQPDLVGRGHRRRTAGLGLELRDDVGLHVAGQTRRRQGRRTDLTKVPRPAPIRRPAI